VSNPQIKPVVEPLFADYLQRYEGCELLCLATTDGFPVVSQMLPNMHLEADAMAAASSTLFSVSNAISRQMLERPFKVAFVESDRGNVAFVALTAVNLDLVLTMSANDQMNIGQLRTLIGRLANEVVERCGSLAAS